MEIDPTRFGSADPGPFLHGTKVDRVAGDLLEPGRSSNFGEGRQANFVYLTAVLDAAVWGAELAQGDGPGRIYLVEPTGRLRGRPEPDRQEVPRKRDEVVPHARATAGARRGRRLGGP